MRRRAITAAAILGMAALLTSCGKSGSTNTAPNGTELLDRLTPVSQPAVIYVDLAAARTALGIGAVNPRAIAANDLAQSRYAALYTAAFPLLGKPAAAPLLDLLDLTKVKAVANNGFGAGKRQVVVLATDQTFEDVAVKLVALGYQRDGSVLNQEDPARGAGASTVAGGPGVIAVGDNADLVRAAAQGGAEGIHGPVRDLVDILAAPAILATAISATCPAAIAIADDLTGNRGRLAVIDDAANADRLSADDATIPVLAGKRFDHPTVDRKRLTVSFSYEPRAPPRPLDILPAVSVRDLYQC